MNSKRSRKNIGGLPTNINGKRTKIATAPLITEQNSEENNVKNRKKKNTSTEKLSGTKRKLLDNNATLIIKKAKKNEIESLHLNNTENLETLPCLPSSSNTKKKLRKTNQKREITTDPDKYFDNKSNQNTVDILSPFGQKKENKKNKCNKNISEGHVTSSVKGNSEGNSNEEIRSDEVNGQLNLKIENGNTKDCVENVNVSRNKGFINWPKEDLKKLVDRMELCTPENDTLAFGTRVEKLEWDTIAFEQYSVEECKNTWFVLQKQIRRFRLLKEVLADAKEWINLGINTPKNKKKKTSRHPDMPKKPLSAYFIYYLEKRDLCNKSYPGSDATKISKLLGQEFKSFPPEKRLKYENLAATQKEEYEKRLEEFYQTHPDVPRIMKHQKIKPEKKSKPPKLPKAIREKSIKPPKERIPKRPPPPFHYYYLSEFGKQNRVDDRLTFKELCKERWKRLSDEEKVVWINNAEMEYIKYEENLQKYLQNHPDCMQNRHKSILTKEEIQIKDRLAGKPSKPPGSAYNLFARVMLQSEEIKSVPVRDRLNFVSNQWKNCKDEEKKQYKDLSLKLNDQYKLDYASYLETLPEDERKLELQKKIPKKRKTEIRTEKKEKRLKKKPSGKKLVEPEQPPISAFKYFTTLYTGEEPVLKAWKTLLPEDKKIYEEELVKKKQAYIVNFEKFLKSLTKDELEAFSNSRKKIRIEPNDDDEGTETSDDSETEESGAETNDDDGKNCVN